MKNLLNKITSEIESWEDYGYNDYDNTPYRTRMRWDVNKNNKVEDRWEDSWEGGHDDKKYWNECKHIDAILEQSIGKPFADVYSKICKDFSKVYRWGKTGKQYFKDQFDFGSYKRFVRNTGYYYVDENGLIQWKKSERKQKRRTIALPTGESDVFKVNHDEIQNHTELMNTIWYTLGAEKYYKLLDSDEISEKFYNELKQATHYDSGIYKIINIMETRWVYDKNIHKGEYRRIKAEDEDARKKRQREREKEREEYLDNLIQYIEWKRKQVIHPEPDEQNRDRHGFNDWSFKKIKES